MKTFFLLALPVLWTQMVKTVFLKSIVFLLLSIRKFYGLFRMSSFHAHAKLKISNLCCLNQRFIAYLLFNFSECMRSVGVGNLPTRKMTKKFSNSIVARKNGRFGKTVFSIVIYRVQCTLDARRPKYFHF